VLLEADPLLCPDCRVEMKIVSVITDGPATKRGWHPDCVTFGMRFFVVLLAGCSTALSTINDPEVDTLRAGMKRAEVERIVGDPDGERHLDNGQCEVTYNVTLGIPERADPNWNSAEATAVAGQSFQGNWGVFFIIPVAITAGTFVVAEGINTGAEASRLSHGRLHAVIILYDSGSEVVRYRISPPPSATRVQHAPANRVSAEQSRDYQDRLLREKWESRGTR